MNFLNNIKELKEFSLRNLLIVTSSILVFLFSYKEFNNTRFNDLLKSVSLFGKKLNYEEWSSVVVAIQIFLGVTVLISISVYIIFGLVYTYFWSKMRDCVLLNTKRKFFLDWIGQLFITTSISYLNLLGYSHLFQGDYINTNWFTFPSIFGVFFVLIYTMAFIITNSDDAWF
jgi:hypothetical protein